MKLFFSTAEVEFLVDLLRCSQGVWTDREKRDTPFSNVAFHEAKRQAGRILYKLEPLLPKKEGEDKS